MLSIVLLSGTMNAMQTKILHTLAFAGMITVPTSILTTLITQHNQTNAAVFEQDLKTQTQVGTEESMHLATLKLEAFNKQYTRHSLTTFVPTISSTGALVGVCAAILERQNKMLPQIAIATGTISVFAAVYDYNKISKAMRAANAITPESLAAEAKKQEEAAIKAREIANRHSSK